MNKKTPGTNTSMDSLGRPGVSRLDLFACALPLGLIAALLGIYFIDREFYLTYIIEPLRREYQAVEIATFLFLMIAGIGGPASVAPAGRPGRDAGAVRHCFGHAGERLCVWGRS